MQDYNTIIGAIQMRLNKCPTRSVMDRFRIGSSTLNVKVKSFAPRQIQRRSFAALAITLSRKIF